MQVARACSSAEVPLARTPTAHDKKTLDKKSQPLKPRNAKIRKRTKKESRGVGGRQPPAARGPAASRAGGARGGPSFYKPRGVLLGPLGAPRDRPGLLAWINRTDGRHRKVLLIGVLFIRSRRTTLWFPSWPPYVLRDLGDRRARSRACSLARLLCLLCLLCCSTIAAAHLALFKGLGPPSFHDEI